MRKSQMNGSLFFLCLMFLSGFAGIAKSDILNSKVEVSMRMIGHKVLHDSGDSTSRVLPIIKEGNSYLIQFDSSLQIDPGNLVSTIFKVISKEELATNYLVEVKSCDNEKVVYSYQIGGADTTSIVPCGGRILPKACYSISIIIIESALPFVTDEYSKQHESIVDDTSYSTLLILILLMTIGIAVFYFFKKRRESFDSPHLIRIGNYQFDKRNMVLIFENINIELTSKEADLLLLLHSSANITVKRELILEKVWGDEGDYIGRTLDVFISKLRKKLQADENIKIANIRGIGYRLILNG